MMSGEAVDLVTMTGRAHLHVRRFHRKIVRGVEGDRRDDPLVAAVLSWLLHLLLALVVRH